MITKRIITIHEERNFAGSVSQRIKNSIWNICGTSAQINQRGFDTDEDVDVDIYFTASENQMETLMGNLKHMFPSLQIDTTKKD